MRKLLVLLLDGLGDRAYPELDGRSSNEVANTPVLDAIAAAGSCGLLWPLGPGRVPSSERAHWEILGAGGQPFPGRAVLEALGHDQRVDREDALAYTTLRTVRERDGALWVTGRPAAADADKCSRLLDDVRFREVDGFEFALAPIGLGEAILRVGGGALPGITDSDPFFADRTPVLEPQPLDAGSARGARAVATWTRVVAQELGGHAINRQRVARGLDPLGALTTKWWGRSEPGVRPFAELHGLDGALVGASPFLAGLAATLGMAFVHSSEGDDPTADLRGRLRVARRLFEDGRTFVLCHVKALDEAGHTKDPWTRVEVIEQLDMGIGDVLDSPVGDVVAAITGDHATPAVPEMIHSGDPVPFMLAGPGVRSDGVGRFGEAAFAAGILGHLCGGDVMPVLLNAANRALFEGSRPTAVPGATGFPASPRALSIRSNRAVPA